MQTDSVKLRQLACWYREQAERAENPVIWDARLRTAEELEAEAERIEGNPVPISFLVNSRSAHQNQLGVRVDQEAVQA